MSHELYYMYQSIKVQFPGMAFKLKKSRQKKFLKIFRVVPGLAVKTNVFLYKKFQDESPSSNLYKKLRRGIFATSTFT